MTMSQAVLSAEPRETARPALGGSAEAHRHEESLQGLYDKHFMIVPAVTDTLKREAFNLRYRVLAEEHNYLDPTEYPEQVEYDEYDARSDHFLLVHRGGNLLAGTVRVIRPEGDAGDELQIVHHCGIPDLGERLPLEQTGEVSRFAVSRQFRRRLTDGTVPDVYDPNMGRTPDQSEVRRLVPYITLGLMQGVVTSLVDNRLTHCATVMEPTLVRLLQRFGLFFDRQGPLIALYGWRQPCSRRLKDLLGQCMAERRDVWEIITDGGRLWDELVSYDR